MASLADSLCRQLPSLVRWLNLEHVECGTYRASFHLVGDFTSKSVSQKASVPTCLEGIFKAGAAVVISGKQSFEQFVQKIKEAERQKRK